MGNKTLRLNNEIRSFEAEGDLDVIAQVEKNTPQAIMSGTSGIACPLSRSHTPREDASDCFGRGKESTCAA